MPNSDDFNRFAYNPVNVDISRSMFNMDHSVKFSCNVGQVIPFDVTEVLPGDTFSVDTSKVVRLQPLVAPIMDEVILDTYWFFVPNRLVWTHWKEFMGENNESYWTPETEYSIPVLEPPDNGWNIGTIADYMGVPVKHKGVSVSALPFRAYALICDQWFRSEALMDPVHVFVDDTTRKGTNGTSQVSSIELGGSPFIACKFFDYFTGALPSPQRGDAVSLNFIEDPTGAYYAPVSSVSSASLPVHPQSAGQTKQSYDAPVHITYNLSTNNKFSNFSNGYPLGVNSAVGNGTLDNISTFGGTSSTGNTVFDSTTSGLYFDNLYAQIYSTYFHDITINELRTAFAMQKYLERQARYGGRYTEFIKGFFNVESPDARLQRSEYLGGSRLSLNINQVTQTSATQDGTTPLGDVAGMSVTGDSHSDFTKSFTEHGYLIGCAVVRYHHSYQQGLERHWSRRSKWDYYVPLFANLGEQAIKESEIYYDGTEYNVGPLTFGYQERWAEYRYKPNRISGELRSQADNSLDMWHLGDYYTARPFLNANWIRENKNLLDRCLAVTSDVSNQIICDFFISMEASRPMPLYSVPGLIDHH